MPAEIRETIREIEGEAEKLIETARADARGILEDASKKARDIMSSEILMEDVKSERDRIISAAEEEAKRKLRNRKRLPSESSQILPEK